MPFTDQVSSITNCYRLIESGSHGPLPRDGSGDQCPKKVGMKLFWFLPVSDACRWGSMIHIWNSTRIRLVQLNLELVNPEQHRDSLKVARVQKDHPWHTLATTLRHPCHTFKTPLPQCHTLATPPPDFWSQAGNLSMSYTDPVHGLRFSFFSGNDPICHSKTPPSHFLPISPSFLTNIR